MCKLLPKIPHQGHHLKQDPGIINQEHIRVRESSLPSKAYPRVRVHILTKVKFKEEVKDYRRLDSIILVLYAI